MIDKYFLHEYNSKYQMKQENCLIYCTKYFYFGRLIMLKWYNHIYFALLDTDISEGA